MCIAAWAYITAAIAMGTTAVLFVEPPGWELPAALMGPLVYWILICSVLGYYIVTWATQHLPASQARPAAGHRAHRRWDCCIFKLFCVRGSVVVPGAMQHLPTSNLRIPSKR